MSYGTSEEERPPTTTTIGILLFDKVEELDFAGPWEVFTLAQECGADVATCTIAERGGVVHCAKGLRVIPGHGFADAPKLDIVVVPGGRDTRAQAHNEALLAWLKSIGPGCSWIASDCTGSLLLAASGLAAGRRVTTHWAFADTLAKRGDVDVVRGQRYVQDGNLVTSADVSAGIDMSLWLLGQLFGDDLARETQRQMEYDPDPPYDVRALLREHSEA